MSLEPVQIRSQQIHAPVPETILKTNFYAEKIASFEKDAITKLYHKNSLRVRAALEEGKFTYVSIGKNKLGNDKIYLVMENIILGYGGNHTIHLGFSRKGAIRAVAKPKRLSSEPSKAKTRLHQAHSLLKGCPNVIQLKSKLDARGYCVYELAKGDLVNVMRANASLVNAKQLMLDCLEAGVQMTEKGIIHLDLKPENILVGTDGRLKIGDLERVSFLDGNGISIDCAKWVAAWGVPFYHSPERHSTWLSCNENPQFNPIGAKDNVWTFMHILCIIAEKSQDERFRLILDFRKQFQDYTSQILKIQAAALTDTQRYSTQYYQVFHSQMTAFFNSCPHGNLFGNLTSERLIDRILKGMAAINPKERMSIQEARDSIRNII